MKDKRECGWPARRRPSHTVIRLRREPDYLRQDKARRGGELGPLIEIPCTATLRRMLNGMDRVSPLILTTKTGHSLKTVRRILERYLARTRGLAEQAIFNSENSHEQSLQTDRDRRAAEEGQERKK
jgi:hypothetical protein